MITIKTHDIDSEIFESEVCITGSGKEVLRDFYALIDSLEKDKKSKLLYEIAKRKYEKNRGTHENKN